MKKIFVFLLGFLFFVIIACEKQVDIEAEKVAVQTAIDQLSQATETKDIELFSQLVAHDEDMVSFGTDAAERWIGWESSKEAAQKQFDAFDSIKFSVRDQIIKISQSGTVAWYSQITDLQVIMQGEQISVEGIRSTGVLEKRDGKWVLVQSHGSVPVSGQAVEH